jgi:hypothetical protein
MPKEDHPNVLSILLSAAILGISTNKMNNQLNCIFSLTEEGQSHLRCMLAFAYQNNCRTGRT